jgi:hypothetical protein
MLLTQAVAHVQKCGRECNDAALVRAARLGKDRDVQLLLETYGFMDRALHDKAKAESEKYGHNDIKPMLWQAKLAEQIRVDSDDDDDNML